MNLKARSFFRASRRIVDALTLVTFVSFFAFLLASTDYDWDHFLTAFEVDLRSWTLDLAPPMWSYQFCAGVTRLGDPQSFGLSPMFLPILLFGSLWGTKLFVFGIWIWGFFALERLLALIAGMSTRSAERTASEAVMLRVTSLSFLFGNYFLWHVHHGHLTFAQMVFAIVIAERFASFLAEGGGRAKILWLGFLVFAYFSSGLYHSLIFFVLPVSIALLLTAAGFYLAPSLRPSRQTTKRLGIALGVSALGVLLASYKLLGVAGHQAARPRTLAPISESLGLSQILGFQLLPTIDYRLPAGLLAPSPWGIWEYSSFQLNIWLLILFALPYLLRRFRKGRPLSARSPSPSLRFGIVFGCALAAVAFSFSLGSESVFSLYYWLNKALNSSVRVVGRYGIGFALASLVVAVAFFARVPRARRRFAVYAAIPALILLNLNFLSFSSLRFVTFLDFMKLERIPLGDMNAIAVVPARSSTASFMYSAVMSGAAAANCYNPINREAYVMGERNGLPEFTTDGYRLRFARVHPFVDEETARVQPECAAGSYFTQNRLHIHPSCKTGACFNLNDVNPREADSSGLRFDKERRKLCLVR